MTEYDRLLYCAGRKILREFEAEQLKKAAAYASDGGEIATALLEARQADELTLEELAVDVLERLCIVGREEGFSVRKLLDEIESG